MDHRFSEKVDRRKFLKLAGLAGLALAGSIETIACSSPAAAPPAPTAAASGKATAPPSTPKTESAEEIQAKLVEAAKNEGKVSLYSTGSVEELEDIGKVFNKKYPFIELEPYHGTAEEITEKVITEYKGGRRNVDLVRGSSTALFALTDAGLAMKYLSPESASLPKGTFDPEGAWHFSMYTVQCMAWNTKAIPEADAPRLYDDLLNPKYKGKIALEAEPTEWFAQQLEVRGKDKGLEFMRKLAEQKPRIIKGSTTLTRLIVAGEVPIGLPIYVYRVQLDKESKAPIDWSAGKPATSNQAGVLIAKDAPHPNAAKLMVNWWLSKEGQEDEVVAVSKRLPVRSGVSVPDFYKGMEVYYASLETLRQSSQTAPMIREIFGIS